MKQVVIDRKPKASESRFNPKFMGFAEYYDIVIRLCYLYRPETKGKIENTIKYARNNFWSGRTFESLSDINVQCREWLQKVNPHAHGTTQEIPLHRMKDETLNPPSSVPAYMTRKEEIRKVSRDFYVSYKGNRYSVSQNFHDASIAIGKAFSDYNECRPFHPFDQRPPSEFGNKFMDDPAFMERFERKEVEVKLDKN